MQHDPVPDVREVLGQMVPSRGLKSGVEIGGSEEALGSPHLQEAVQPDPDRDIVTSSSRTLLLRCILAWASDIMRMIDSMCRTAMGTWCCHVREWGGGRGRGVVSDGSYAEPRYLPSPYFSLGPTPPVPTHQQLQDGP